MILLDTYNITSIKITEYIIALIFAGLFIVFMRYIEFPAKKPK